MAIHRKVFGRRQFDLVPSAEWARAWYGDLCVFPFSSLGTDVRSRISLDFVMSATRK